MRIKSTLFSCISLLASTNYLLATDIFVPTDYPSIQQALDAAVDGDHIYVQPGVYYETVGRHAPISVSITGLGGAEQTVIDASGSGKVFEFGGEGVGSISLKGLSFVNGYVSTDDIVYGAGVEIYDAHTIIDECIIMKNHAQTSYSHIYGSGLYLFYIGTEPSRISRTKFIGNYGKVSNGNGFAMGVGAYVNSSGSATNIIFESCIFAGNTADGDNAITADSILRLSNRCDIRSSKLDHSQSVSCATVGTHGSNNIFCGDVYGAIAGTGNIYECNLTTDDGACCIEGECYEMHQDQCITLMGVFNGQYTTCSNTTCNPLDDPSGACCISGMCAEMSESNCAAISGTWAGDYLLCSQVNCEPPPPTAACCLGSTCAMVQEETCGEMGGIWWAGSNCKKAKCVPWTGGCCIDGSCLDVTLDECFSASGSYAGDLTSCKNGVECNDSCLGDINNDGVVNVSDLLTMISVWGACP